MSKLTQDTPLNKAIGIGLVTLIGATIILGSRAVSAQDITIQDIADYHGTECVDADIQTKNGTNYSININTASQVDIAEHLYWIGYSKAQAVVDYRTDNGEFNSLSDLTAVNGVGTKTAEKNRCFLHLFHCKNADGQNTNDASQCANQASE
ncbi:helix-hairpin-helix domain-containing protein [Candidatus Albibeggiatoa sp. nov. BB20]|uniref:ComEA family DNA-binding protein n=1 Tax=Candidatus Albibeggiatoa sp. nov. BB20 TaxID=3162723 RepID=UPI0033656544